MEIVFFKPKIAKKYGVNCAILLQNLYYWVEKNKANNVHFHDGYYWTYNSYSAFSDLFDFLNERQIRYALDTLIKEKLILTGNYNEDGSRTLWYTVTEKAVQILLNENLVDEEEKRNSEVKKEEKSPVLDENDHVTKLSDTCDKIVRPCDKIVTSYIGTNINANININNNIKETHKEKPLQDVCDKILDFWNSKDLIKCECSRDELYYAVSFASKKHALQDILTAIEHYDEILHSSYYMCYQWNLVPFLTKKQTVAKFLDKGEFWLSYLKDKSYHKPQSNNQTEIMRNNYMQEQINSVINNLDNLEV